jgi:hypothetical protein
MLQYIYIYIYRERERERERAVRLPSYRREGRKEYSSYSFLTSALDGGEWAARPGSALAPGKDPRYP